MRRWIWLLAAWLLTGCATLIEPPRAPTATPDAALAAYARVLDRHVDARGRVDFAAIAREPQDLHRYVAFVAATPAADFAAGAPRLAHLINSYNALSIYNVIESGFPASHAGLRKVGFFVLRKLAIGGERRSLYSYENDVIRPLGDPRVHFALNCSAVSCPTLPRRPFSAAGLDAELDRETRAFFARADNLRVDPAARTVWLSENLSFYAEDFVPAHAPSLLAYAARYSATPLPADYGVRFVPYDWTVANQRR